MAPAAAPRRRPTHGPAWETLGVRLTAARRRAGLTQHQVAAQLGLPRSGVSEIETGHRKVYATELGHLARLYGEPVDNLLAGLPQE
ncbi:helix-turn-helix domain-containing protein [Streptomyces pseudogriseolus]|uniref:helix-turn-helix domain-containing protein n=1 Tax=Streptomyces pseudogriseolus TaxID=36817 RepID=UPI003FA2428D